MSETEVGAAVKQFGYTFGFVLPTAKHADENKLDAHSGSPLASRSVSSSLLRFVFPKKRDALLYLQQPFVFSVLNET